MSADQKNQRLRAYREGLWAEYLAAMIFRIKGYRIVAHRYKSPGGEIDLIAVKKKSLVFVEIKARKKTEDGLYAVGEKSRYRITKAARHFLALNPDYANFEMRFDVMVIVFPFHITHLDNAWFTAP